MAKTKIKICPFFTQYQLENSVLTGGGPFIVSSVVKCIGENCINFENISGEGYCSYFERYTGHEDTEEGGAADENRNGNTTT